MPEYEPLTFGDVVKVLISPDTERLEIAGSTGLIAGVPPHVLGIEDDPPEPCDRGQFAVDIAGMCWALNRSQLQLALGPPSGWHMNRVTHPSIFARLEQHWGTEIGQRIYCGWGWAEILRSFHDTVVEVDPNYRLWVVKEKWGELAINAGQHNSDTAHSARVAEIIELARQESTEICEWCGDPGQLRELTRERTLCDPCTSAMVESGEEHGRQLES